MEEKTLITDVRPLTDEEIDAVGGGLTIEFKPIVSAVETVIVNLLHPTAPPPRPLVG